MDPREGNFSVESENGGGMSAQISPWVELDRQLRATPQWFWEPRSQWPAHVDAGTLPENVYAEWLSEMDRRRESRREQQD
jgi:hypothetical protein